MPWSSLSCSWGSLRGNRAAVSSSQGLSRRMDAPGGVSGRRAGGGAGEIGVGDELNTGRGGGGIGEEVRDRESGEGVREKGSGEQVRDGGVGVEGREMEGGGERLLRSPHCSRLSLVLLAGRACVRTNCDPAVSTLDIEGAVHTKPTIVLSSEAGMKSGLN